jgi:hypothetical protein
MPSTRYLDLNYTEIAAAAIEALGAAGFPSVDDHNEPGAVGVGRMPMNTRDGVRVTTADAYLPLGHTPAKPDDQSRCAGCRHSLRKSRGKRHSTHRWDGRPGGSRRRLCRDVRKSRPPDALRSRPRRPSARCRRSGRRRSSRGGREPCRPPVPVSRFRLPRARTEHPCPALDRHVPQHGSLPQ